MKLRVGEFDVSVILAYFFSKFSPQIFITFFVQGKNAKCRQYVGHSAHVTNVRFSLDDDRLVSVGGADTAVIVWRLQGGSRDAGPAAVCSTAHMSEDSDTDSEEEGQSTMSA